MWWSTKCKLGHTHHVWVQQKSHSCSVACIMMALHRVGKLNAAKKKVIQKVPGLKELYQTKKKKKKEPWLTEGELRLATQHAHKGGYRPVPKDVSGAKETMLSKLMSGMKGMDPSIHHGTSGLGPVAATLNWLNVKCQFQHKPSSKSVLAYLKGVQWWHPVVAGVRWTGGFEHAVLVDCATKLKNGDHEICICDPAGEVHTICVPAKLETLALYPEKGVFMNEVVYVP